MSERPHIEIFTDGACSGNPGPGGWGAILRSGENEREINGREDHTTNNKMELTAAISALEALKWPSIVDLTTDSQYVRDGITKWINNWKRNGWVNAEKKPVKNADLWQRLDDATRPHKVNWHWIKGHAGHRENERADYLAREAIAGRVIIASTEGDSQKHLIGRLVRSVRSSIKIQNWYCALVSSLVLPDICAELESPTEDRRMRYARWWDRYLQLGYNKEAGASLLDGRDAYDLRLAILRDSDNDLATFQAREALDRFRFVTPPGNGSLHRKRRGSVLLLQVDQFCEEICIGVDRWSDTAKNDSAIQMKITSLPIIEDGKKL